MYQGSSAQRSWIINECLVAKERKKGKAPEVEDDDPNRASSQREAAGARFLFSKRTHLEASEYFQQSDI